MNEGSPGVVRLAMGSFSDPATLAATLSELLQSGVKYSELCLVGTRQAFKAIGEKIDHRTTSVVAGLLQIPDGPSILSMEQGELLATPGPVRQMLVSDASGGVSHGGVLGNKGSFARLLGNHAIVLLVNTATAELHKSSSRVLLRHSSHIVQTHEFTPGKPSVP
jgi:hypothetical protein